MKTLRYISILCVLLIAASFNSCKDDDKKWTSDGITGQSWRKGEPLEITTGNELSVSFTASGDWTAKSNSAWCELLNNSGKAGNNTLKILVKTDAIEKRTAIITFSVKGYEASSSVFDLEITQQKTASSLTEDMEVNSHVDSYLKKAYLWNDEYKTLSLNYTKNYQDFFNGALLSMKTNTLDKKKGANNVPYLFSYIEKLNSVSETRATKLVHKELAYSFGVTGVTPVSIGTSDNYTIYFCIQGVYPGSPAAIGGIKRGSMISRINGNKIDNKNIEEYFYSLLYPTAAFNLKLTEDVIEEGIGTKEINITSKAMYCNPVIYSKVEEISGRKVGYLVYSGFDAGFDQELFDAFKGLKNQGVDDLILDLRYNGGGYVISANLIATCIAGEASQGKVFSSSRYNRERMEGLGNQREEDHFAYRSYANLGSSLSAGSLRLTRVYCLVGNRTASSSELVINSLRGIDVEVILIGEKTTGKNVGMEVKELSVRGNTYRVAPITFQSYNAKGYGDYENGFEPDHRMDETNPNNESSVFYIHKEYGTNKEPLYAKAIELITGQKPPVMTRSMQSAMKGNVHKMPLIFRPGHDGMLKKYEAAE